MKGKEDGLKPIVQAYSCAGRKGADVSAGPAVAAEA